MVEAAAHVAALVRRVGERPQRARLVAGQAHAREAAHEALQHGGAERRGRVVLRGQQQVVGVRGLRVRQQRVHGGGAELARVGLVTRAARRARRLRAPGASVLLCTELSFLVSCRKIFPRVSPEMLNEIEGLLSRGTFLHIYVYESPTLDLTSDGHEYRSVYVPY